MKKIASPPELQAEIRAIMAFVHASEKPDRQVVASKLRALADRLAGARALADAKRLQHYLNEHGWMSVRDVLSDLNIDEIDLQFALEEAHDRRINILEGNKQGVPALWLKA